jgi:hypothetical protein
MFLKYKVTHYDSYAGDEFKAQGIVWAADYGSAADKVQNEYGRENIVDIYLSEISTDGTYCIEKDELDEAFNEN